MFPIKNSLKGKSVLITGGTGSFGRKFVEMALHNCPDIERLVIYSRDELKQYEMNQIFPDKKYEQMRYFIGDVRDNARLLMAFEGVDTVIHAAALKQVQACEYNPFEAVKTNIFGAQNVIEAAMLSGVKNVIALSTDKAAAPINLYGATKLCSDKLFAAANAYKGKRNLRFSVVRYGNVMGSRGSVIPFFLKERHKGVLPITHEQMSRFNITLQDAVKMVLFVHENMWGGEIFVPKIPSYKILDLAEAIAPKCQKKIVGIRPGEKIHEDLITDTDSHNTIEFGKYYVILPSYMTWDVKSYINTFMGKACPIGFKYNSGINEEWLSVEQIRSLISKHIDPNFTA